MTDDTVIAEWPLNKREHVRVSIEKFKGVDLVNVRKWFKAHYGEMRPGKGGIALHVKHLPQLTDAMMKALAIATAHGLVREAPSDDRTSK
jgi:hypothetical protein